MVVQRKGLGVDGTEGGAFWVVGESEEAGRRTLSSHGPENPEEKEIALSLRKWVPLVQGGTETK